MRTLRWKLVLVALVVNLSGCVFLLPGQGGYGGAQEKPVEIEEKLIAKAPLTAIPETQQVRVVQTVQQLPPGFFYHADRQAKKLYALPDFPTARAPHVVVGALAWKGGRYGTIPEALHERARRWGGNFLFCPPNNGFCYVALESAAAVADDGRGYRELLTAERSGYGSSRPDTEPVRIDLSRAEAVTFETTPSHCYTLLFALDSGARLEAAATGLYGDASTGDRLMSNRSIIATEEVETPEGIVMKAPVNGPYARMRSFSQALGCSAGETKASVQFYAAGRSAALGSGSAYVQILARKISRKELKAKEEQHEKAVEDARRAAEAQRKLEEQRRQEREREERERKAREAQARDSRKSTSSSAGKSNNYSMSLKNNCPRTVRIFIGDKPKFGSGRYTTVSSNSISSYSGFAPQMFWIVDDSDNGISSYTAGPGRHDVEITRSCSGFASR